MKKTWNFGIALALGVSSLPSMAAAQFSSPYGSGALAPSGYAVNQVHAQPVQYPAMQAVPTQYAQYPGIQMQPAGNQMQISMVGVPQLPQPSQMTQSQMPQFVPYANGVPAQTVAYPQEPVPAPAVDAQQVPQKGWVGPHNGQYQPVPDSAPMNVAPMAPGAPAPVYSAPMGSAPATTYVDPAYNSGCTSCGGGYAGGMSSMIAPMATSNVMGGSCGGPAYGGPVYGGPVYAGPIYQGGFPGQGFLAGRSALPGKAFFAGGSALLMTRIDDHNVALTYPTSMPSDNTLGTRDARQYDLNGFEVFGGRYFNCGKNAILVNYWGLYPEDRSFQADAAGAPSVYRSRYHFNGIEMPTQTVYDWFDGARSHRVSRSSEYHNLEANLLGFAVGGAARTWTPAGPRRGLFGAGGYGYGAAGYGGCGYDSCGGGGFGSSCGSGCGDCGSAPDCGSCGSGCAAFTGPCGLTPNMCGSRLNWTWLGGFRWFRFKDGLQYAASEFDTVYNSADDLYYDINTRNDLVGFQLGGAGSYCLGRRLNWYGLSKAGVYNNHSQFSTSIYRNGGPEATINSANIYNGESYMVTSTKNQLAFLGEVGTGVGVRVTRGWSANVGYRVIGAAGVATAVNNIPIEMIHLGNVADFNNTSSLVLHGWTIGGMYNF